MDDQIVRGLERVTGKLQTWVEALVANLPNIAVAVVVLIMFEVLSRGISKLARRSLERATANRQAAQLVGLVVRLVLVAVGLFIALGVLRLDQTVMSLLAGVGVIGLALGFAFQHIAADYMSGVLIALRRPFKEGDLIETESFMGFVEEMGLRATVGRTFQGQRVFMPNRDLFGKPLTNYFTGGERRVDIDVGVTYGEDLEEVKRVTREALEGVPGRDTSRPAEVFFLGFGDSSIDLSARLWIQVPQQDFFAVRSDAVVAIKRAYDAAGITIPFPIRTLDFAQVGGTRLDQSLGRWWSHG